MEQYLRQYFWTVWLAFIALAAFLGTRAVNQLVGAAIEPEPVLVADPGPVRRPLPGVATATLDVAELGHLFGIDPPPPAEAGEAAIDPALAGLPADVCWDCKPVKSGLRLQLLGTVVANEKRWSTALIHDLDKQSTAVYVHGDELKPKKAIVFDIQREPQRVIIINEETRRLEYIDGVPGDGKPALVGMGNLGTAPVPAPEAGGDDEADSNDGIRQISDNEYAITQEKLNSTLSDLNKVATQARIVPSFKNGVANGFKLFSIRPGSLYSAIGIQNGDVITRINGFDINSPDKALEIYQRLRDARNVEIDIERRGQVMKKRYTIE